MLNENIALAKSILNKAGIDESSDDYKDYLKIREIVGNNNNDLGEVILTDQRNEVVVTPYTSGTITLRATYMNTLLHCGGQAEFEIFISKCRFLIDTVFP